MADITLTATPALGGAALEIGANTITERDDLALVSVAVPNSGEKALDAALQSGLSVALPGPRRSIHHGGMRAFCLTQDQVMLVFSASSARPDAGIQRALNGAGYATDQTDVWVAIETSGPDIHAALERICPLDLHDQAFPVDSAARTMMEHMGAIIIRTANDRFLLFSARSSAQSFLHAVETSFRYVTVP